MSSHLYETGINDIVRIIPPNPSDIQFEADFRSNTELFLEKIKVFNTAFQDLVNDLGYEDSYGDAKQRDILNIRNNIVSMAGAGLRLEVGLLDSLLAESSNTNSETLNLPQTHDIYEDGSTTDLLYTVESTPRPFENLRFSSLQDRFEYIDDRSQAARLQIKEALEDPNSSLLNPSDSWDGYNNLHWESLDQRFRNAETLIKNGYSDLFSYAEGSTQSLEKRFENVEKRAKETKDEIDQTRLPNQNIFTLFDRFASIEKSISDGHENNTVNTWNSGPFANLEGRFAESESRINSLETVSNSLSSAYAPKYGSSANDFEAKNLTIHGDLSTSNGEFEINEHNHSGGTYTYLKVKDIDSTHGQLDQAVNKKYIDNINTILSQQIGNINGSTVPGFQQSNALFNVPDGKFLSMSSGSLTWADPPTFDPNTSPYGWLTHPQVAFHEVQFDGELYLDRTLTAGFTYFIAGDLVFPDFMPDGTTPCNSVLTLDSGILGKEGATLIVQGHIIGDITSLARIVEDSTNPNLPRIIVQNWADSRADYVVTGTKKTSDLNLSEDIVFAGNLRLEAGSTLEVDTAIQLTFKSLINNGGTITLTDPNAGVSYFDPQKLIDGAPAALDTLLEISAAITDTDTDVLGLLSDMTNVKAAITDTDTDVLGLLSDMTNVKNDISNLSSNIGSMAYRQDANGNHIYKFNP